MVYLSVSASASRSACLHVCLSPILPSKTFILSFLLLSLGQKVENSQNLSSSEPRSLQESKEHMKREHEGITVRFPREKSLSRYNQA